MKKITLLLALISFNAFSYEYNVNRYNETLISFNKSVLGVNCTPFSFGKILGVSNIQNTTKNFFLRLVPNKKNGALYCSFKLSNDELVQVKFNLGDTVKTPVVDIKREVNKTKLKNDLLTFVDFSRGKPFKELGLNLSEDFPEKGKSYKTKENTYNIKKRLISKKGIFFYVIKSKNIITDQFFKLHNLKTNNLKYSTIINKDNASFIYLASYKPIKFKGVLP